MTSDTSVGWPDVLLVWINSEREFTNTERSVTAPTPYVEGICSSHMLVK
jgi:hypothetical protein